MRQQCYHYHYYNVHRGPVRTCPDLPNLVSATNRATLIRNFGNTLGKNNLKIFLLCQQVFTPFITSADLQYKFLMTSYIATWPKRSSLTPYWSGQNVCTAF